MGTKFVVFLVMTVIGVSGCGMTLYPVVYVETQVRQYRVRDRVPHHRRYRAPTIYREHRSCPGGSLVVQGSHTRCIKKVDSRGTRPRPTKPKDQRPPPLRR